MALGKLLIVIGLLIVLAGLLVWWGIPVGRLPGDFVIRRGPITFYFPLTTAIIASLLLTLVLTLFRR